MELKLFLDLIDALTKVAGKKCYHFQETDRDMATTVFNMKMSKSSELLARVQNRRSSQALVYCLGQKGNNKYK